MKPLSKIYMLQLQWNLYQFFPTCIIFLRHSFLPVLKIHPHEQCINVSGASFLKVLYDSINHSDCLVLTHNIPRKIISEEKTVKATMTFLECKTVVTYCYGYSCNNNYEMSPHLGQVRNGDGRAAEVMQKTLRRIFFLIFCWLCISIYLFINIHQLDALNFIITLFQASTCLEHMCSSSGWQNCIIQSPVSLHLYVTVPCTVPVHSLCMGQPHIGVMIPETV